MPSIRVLYAVKDPPTPLVRLPAQLLDLVCEAVLEADEAARGAVAARLVREVYDAVAWLHPDPHHHERVSFQRVVDEADAHQARLTEPPGLPLAPLEVAR